MSRISSSARSSSAPMTTRSGRMKSSMAEPSRRNSGLQATSKSAAGIGLARRCRATWRRGAHGDGALVDDDLVARRGGGRCWRHGLEDVATGRPYPSPRRAGVPTAMKMTCAPGPPAARSVVKWSRPAATFCAPAPRVRARRRGSRPARARRSSLGRCRCRRRGCRTRRSTCR